MKASLVTVVLVAVASSLVTVGGLELLRGARAGSPRVDAVDTSPAPSGARTPREVAPRGPEALIPPTDDEERFQELERRIAALEMGATARRAAVPRTAGELPPEDRLRDLVLDWVAEERETRARARELEAQDEKQKELEFGARYSARMLAEKHGLAKWQEDELARLFLETEERRLQIEESIDLATDDPGEVEARWVEFDEWAEERERELALRLDPGLYEDLYGED